MQTCPVNHCHIYYAHADDLPGELAPYFAQLSTEEQARVHRYVFERDQRQSLCAHLLKRQVLARYCEVEPAALQFGVHEYGKPYLADFPQWHFNISHAQGLVMLAVRRDHALGVDVETPRAQLQPLELAQRYFHPGEQALFVGKTPEDIATLFYRLWTCKEAILKAYGVGIAHHLEAVCLTLQGDQLRIRSLPESFGDGQNWHLQELIPVKNARVAVASPFPIDKVELFAANLT